MVNTLLTKTGHSLTFYLPVLSKIAGWTTSTFIFGLIAAFAFKLLDGDIGFVFLLSIFYALSHMSAVKGWVRTEGKFLEENSKQLRFFANLFWVILLIVIVALWAGLGKIISGKTLNILTTLTMLILAGLSFANLIAIAHRLYNSVYNGYRAVGRAVFSTGFPRTLFLMGSYLFGFAAAMCFLGIFPEITENLIGKAHDFMTGKYAWICLITGPAFLLLLLMLKPRRRYG